MKQYSRQPVIPVDAIDIGYAVNPGSKLKEIVFRFYRKGVTTKEWIALKPSLAREFGSALLQEAKRASISNFFKFISGGK